jgi:hypothetical protein
MTNEPEHCTLTDEQKRDVCGVVAAGCDRETAAKYARTTCTAVRAAIDADPEFAAEVRFMEANIELHHMRNVRKAGENVTNWRTSAWWLERLAPERYGPRGTGLVNTKQLKLYIDHISATLVVDVHNDEDRKRLLAKLKHTAKTLELLLRDESTPEQSIIPSASALLAEADTAAPAEPPIADSATSTNEEESA